MDGVLVVDKPEQLTSHDVVVVARRATGEKRIGHTGTLDPLATGVLPLACGRATRLVRFLTGSDKDYDAVIRFGLTTDSYDVRGQETSRTNLQPTRAAVEAAVASLRGRYQQMPPAFSAKKIGGERAYELARRQETVELKAAPVRVTRAEITAFSGDRASVSLTCSAGFYVRSFAHELGIRVNVGACLESLRRTRCGEFTITEAMTLEALRQGVTGVDLIPLERLLPTFASAMLTDEGMTRVSHGRQLQPDHYTLRTEAAPGPGAISPLDADDNASVAAPEWIRLFDTRGQLAALGTRSAPRDNALHPAVVLI